VGDIIYIHDAGAHGFSMGYNYNGKLRSAEVLLKEDAVAPPSHIKSVPVMKAPLSLNENTVFVLTKYTSL